MAAYISANLGSVTTPSDFLGEHAAPLEPLVDYQQQLQLGVQEAKEWLAGALGQSRLQSFAGDLQSAATQLRVDQALLELQKGLAGAQGVGGVESWKERLGALRGEDLQHALSKAVSQDVVIQNLQRDWWEVLGIRERVDGAMGEVARAAATAQTSADMEALKSDVLMELKSLVATLSTNSGLNQASISEAANRLQSLIERLPPTVQQALHDDVVLRALWQGGSGSAPDASPDGIPAAIADSYARSILKDVLGELGTSITDGDLAIAKTQVLAQANEAAQRLQIKELSSKLSALLPGMSLDSVEQVAESLLAQLAVSLDVDVQEVLERVQSTQSMSSLRGELGRALATLDLQQLPAAVRQQLATVDVSKLAAAVQEATQSINMEQLQAATITTLSKMGLGDLKSVVNEGHKVEGQAALSQAKEAISGAIFKANQFFKAMRAGQ